MEMIRLLPLLALLCLASEVPPVPTVKRPKIATATQGSGATSLLSVKAAAIPTPVYMQVSWTPTNIVWTQAVWPTFISNGIEIAWATNRWTNLWEVQEKSDSGPWVAKSVTNRPPVRYLRSAGKAQQIRIRSWWDP